jgi:hypothetical protein
MARRAPILTAGTLITILTCAQPAAAISPQSTATNNQAQLANIVVDQSLNVVDVSDSTTLTAVATGNTFTGSSIVSNLDVQTTQSMTGSASATGRVNVGSNSGASTVLSTNTTGNDSESNVLGGAALTGTSTQTVGAVNILALGEYNGPNAQTSNLANNVQAVANSQTYGLTAATSNVSTTQSSAAITQADAGLTLGYTEGTALISAVATSNNITAASAGTSSQTLNLTQSVTGQRTQATVNANAGNAQTIVGQADAIGNNISITNTTGPLNVVTNQNNVGYVQAQSVVTSYEFGTAQANAYGVGNSVMAGNQGQAVTIDNTQVNSGDGVVAQASFGSGAGGYDSASSAIAMGNAITGYVCSTCGGKMTVTNRQTNSADVAATGVVNVTAASRTATATASATGNTASFYVSSPNGN